MKTLFLHIGTPKTATSSIQMFCAKNRKILQKKGYCYPQAIREYKRIGHNRNGHFLVGTIRCKDDPSVPNAEERRVFQEGLENVHTCFEQFDNVILSDEGIWLASGPDRKRPTLWKDLKEDADKHGYTIKIIVYLRRQDQYFSSRYNQRIKKAGYAQTWEEYAENKPAALHDMLDYASKLNRIAAVFGKENVCVRRFDRSEFYGGSIYADFFQCLGLELTDEYKELENDANMAFKGNTFEFMRIINDMPDLDRGSQDYMRHLVRQCSKEAGDSYKPTMFSKEEAERFLAQYREGNEQVAVDYIGDGRPLFNYEVKESEKWQKQNDYMVDDLIHLLTITTCELHEEVVQLRKETKRLEENTLPRRFKRCIRKKFQKIECVSL